MTDTNKLNNQASSTEEKNEEHNNPSDLQPLLQEEINLLLNTDEYMQTNLERIASGKETITPIPASSSSTSQSTAESINRYQSLLKELISQPNKILQLEKQVTHLELEQKMLQNTVARMEEQVRALTAQLNAQQQAQPSANAASQQTEDKQSSAPSFFAHRRNSM